MTSPALWRGRGGYMQAGKPHPKRVDLAGQTINDLFVVRSRGNWNGRAQWECRCQHCETIVVFDGTYLRSGKARCRACAPSRKRKKAE